MMSGKVYYLLPHSCSNDVLNEWSSNDVLNEWSFLFFRRLVRQPFSELQLQDLQMLLERLMFAFYHDHSHL